MDRVNALRERSNNDCNNDDDNDNGDIFVAAAHEHDALHSSHMYIRRKKERNKQTKIKTQYRY